MRIPGLSAMCEFIGSTVREAVTEAIMGGTRDGTADAIERITGLRPELETVPMLVVEAEPPKKKTRGRAKK